MRGFQIQMNTNRQIPLTIKQATILVPDIYVIRNIRTTLWVYEKRPVLVESKKNQVACAEVDKVIQ